MEQIDNNTGPVSPRMRMSPQGLQFELIKQATFDEFDGERVVKDLEDNSGLWDGCIMDRPDLIKLRDIPDGTWNVDRLYILTDADRMDDLVALTEGWDADKKGVMSGGEASASLGIYPTDKQILWLWWD